MRQSTNNLTLRDSNITRMRSQRRRDRWSRVEDEKLARLIATEGPNNWASKAEKLGSRHPKQCRDRYHLKLKPTLNHGPITPEEGAQIVALVKRMGRRWAKITRKLRGRSDRIVQTGGIVTAREHFTTETIAEFSMRINACSDRRLSKAWR